ncbi:hypothetical protein AK812_SmicGene11070 [Symbiodinium microadriaticum]|uniref:Uncharacterized protein n=1 Tax=Symbiodinium microadriaticum TaxID=2951 RepID=A0A1Q9EE76_SYMMI|nr:hypothetical protein AK812_SmicGene11070 [Symbiodinium microadriaticum]
MSPKTASENDALLSAAAVVKENPEETDKRNVVRALNTYGRIIVPPTKKELKADNKSAAFNRHVLAPVMEEIAKSPNWELRRLRESMTVMVEADKIKLDPDFYFLQTILDPELPPAKRAEIAHAADEDPEAEEESDEEDEVEIMDEEPRPSGAATAVRAEPVAQENASRLREMLFDMRRSATAASSRDRPPSADTSAVETQLVDGPDLDEIEHEEPKELIVPARAKVPVLTRRQQFAVGKKKVPESAEKDLEAPNASVDEPPKKRTRQAKSKAKAKPIPEEKPEIEAPSDDDGAGSDDESDEPHRVLKKPAAKAGSTVKPAMSGGKGRGRGRGTGKGKRKAAALDPEPEAPGVENPEQEDAREAKPKHSSSKVSQQPKASPKPTPSPKTSPKPKTKKSASPKTSPKPKTKTGPKGGPKAKPEARKSGRKELDPTVIREELDSCEQKAHLVQVLLEAFKNDAPCKEKRSECVPEMEYWQFSVYWPPRASVGILRRSANDSFVYITSFNSGIYKDLTLPLECVDFLGGDIEELRHDPGSMAALSYAEMLKQCMKYAFVLNQQPTVAVQVPTLVELSWKPHLVVGIVQPECFPEANQRDLSVPCYFVIIDTDFLKSFRWGGAGWGSQRGKQAMKRKAWFLKRQPFQEVLALAVMFLVWSDNIETLTEDLRFIEYFAGEGIQSLFLDDALWGRNTQTAHALELQLSELEQSLDAPTDGHETTSDFPEPDSEDDMMELGVVEDDEDDGEEDGVEPEMAAKKVEPTRAPPSQQLMGMLEANPNLAQQLMEMLNNNGMKNAASTPPKVKPQRNGTLIVPQSVHEQWKAGGVEKQKLMDKLDSVGWAKFRTMVTKEVTNEREQTMGNGTGFYTEEEMKTELNYIKKVIVHCEKHKLYESWPYGPFIAYRFDMYDSNLKRYYVVQPKRGADVRKHKVDNSNSRASMIDEDSLAIELPEVPAAGPLAIEAAPTGPATERAANLADKTQEMEALDKFAEATLTRITRGHDLIGRMAESSQNLESKLKEVEASYDELVSLKAAAERKGISKELQQKLDQTWQKTSVALLGGTDVAAWDLQSVEKACKKAEKAETQVQVLSFSPSPSRPITDTKLSKVCSDRGMASQKSGRGPRVPCSHVIEHAKVTGTADAGVQALACVSATHPEDGAHKVFKHFGCALDVSMSYTQLPTGEMLPYIRMTDWLTYLVRENKLEYLTGEKTKLSRQTMRHSMEEYTCMKLYLYYIMVMKAEVSNGVVFSYCQLMVWLVVEVTKELRRTGLGVCQQMIHCAST